MQFITFEFYLFFLGVLFFLFPIRGFKRVFKIYLLLVGLFFYYLFGFEKLLILLNFCVVNYLFLYLLKRYKKIYILILALLINVLFLGYYKYTNFFADLLSEYAGFVLNIEVLAPIGISFYTFRVISHLVDYYKGKVVFPSLLNYLLYVTYFPQILSGPIMRANVFYEELNFAGKIRGSEYGIVVMFLSGLIKKFLISSILWDYCQAQFVNPIGFSSVDLIVGVLAYSSLIYTDFSGYSDISIAISKVLGINTKPNFDSPYRAIGLKDFWARWHISLSSWLRDYIYIPLGGSRKFLIFENKFISQISFIPNIIITTFVSGLWHGAGLNFIIWGLLHGIGSVITHFISRIFKESSLRQIPIIRYLLNVIGWAVTFVFINITWIFFNPKSIDSAFSYMSEILKSTNYNNAFLDIKVVLIIFVVILFNFIGNRVYEFVKFIFGRITFLFTVFVLVIIMYAIVRLGPELMPPFIYFGF